MLRAWLRRALRLLGKSDEKIIAVFAASQVDCRCAIDHVRAGAGSFPIWLVTTRPVDENLAQRCDRVIQLGGGPLLPLRAAAALWPRWVTLSVVTFTAEPGFASLKLAPFLVPPWKLLVMNEHGDFFYAWPAGLLLHLARRARDRVATAKDVAVGILGELARGKFVKLALGIFWKLAWTLLDPILEKTSAPWRRPPARFDLAPEDGFERRPGVLVCVNNDAVSRPALQAALDRLALPYRIVPGPPPPSTPFQYILVVDETPAGDLRHLLDLFHRSGTFAARVQLGRTVFQKDTLPRAAFRRLQPGEASAVVAPFPGVVLLDAAKLARLGGLPAAATTRCRWLLLFWKAAAAGWKSYDVGVQRDRLKMIPDRAGAELEFCLRLLRAPRDPSRDQRPFDDRRGSISFQPSLERPLRSDARRILIVSPYLPFPLTHGGAVRIFHLARRLSERYELILLTFRERQDFVDYSRLASRFARVIVVDHDELRRQDPSVPEVVAQFRSRAMAAAIRQAAQEHAPDLLQIEYTQLAEYRDALPDVPAVLVEHDVTFSLYEQLAGRESAPGQKQSRAREEFERWYRFESCWLQRYEAVAVMSEDEKQKATGAGAPADRVWVVPNGVDTERFQPPAVEPASTLELLFVGSFRHLPNMVGFEFLRGEVLPRVWKKFPAVRVQVVAGPEHEKHWRKFAGNSDALKKPDPRIGIEGFVENLLPYYARAHVVLVPLRVSAGTNIKVLEALSCGKAVVSTPVGCAGLGLAEGEEILVAESAEDFALALERLLSDAAFRRKVEIRARQAAVERFGWERSAESAVRMYDAVWSAPRSRQINSCQVVRSSPA